MKNTVRVRPQDIRSLKSFREDYPEAKLLLLYRGAEILDMQGILCLPVTDFLKNLVPSETLDSVLAKAQKLTY